MIDVKLNDEGDVDVSGGDIGYVESTTQHQRDLIVAHKGHYKGVPNVGVGAINFIHDENPENFLLTIRREFTRDGMKVERVAVTGNDLIVNAAYTKR